MRQRVLIIESNLDILKLKAQQAQALIRKLKLQDSKCDFLYHDEILYKLVKKGKHDA